MSAAKTKRLPDEFIKINGYFLLQCELYAVSVLEDANWFTPAHKKEIFVLLDETLLRKSQEFSSDMYGSSRRGGPFARDGRAHKVVGKLAAKNSSNSALQGGNKPTNGFSVPTVLCGDSVRIAFCFQDSLLTRNKVLIKSDDRFRSLRLLPEKLVIFSYLMSNQPDSSILLSNSTTGLVQKDGKIDGTISSFFSSNTTGISSSTAKHSRELQDEPQTKEHAIVAEHVITGVHVMKSQLETKVARECNKSALTSKQKTESVKHLSELSNAAVERCELNVIKTLVNSKSKKRLSDLKGSVKGIKRCKSPSTVAQDNSEMGDELLDNQNAENSSAAIKLSRFKFRRISKSKLITGKGSVGGNSPCVRAARASLDRARRRKSALLSESVLLHSSSSEQGLQKSGSIEKLTKKGCVTTKKLREHGNETNIVDDLTEFADAAPNLRTSSLCEMELVLGEANKDLRQNQVSVATVMKCRDVTDSRNRASSSGRIIESKNKSSCLSDSVEKSVANHSVSKSMHRLMSPTDDDFDFKRPRISHKREVRKGSKLCSTVTCAEKVLDINFSAEFSSNGNSSVSSETSNRSRTRSQEEKSNRRKCDPGQTGSDAAILIDDCDTMSDENTSKSGQACMGNSTDVTASRKNPVTIGATKNRNGRISATLPISLTLLPDMATSLSSAAKDKFNTKSNDTLSILSNSSTVSSARQRSRENSDIATCSKARESNVPTNTKCVDNNATNGKSIHSVTDQACTGDTRGPVCETNVGKNHIAKSSASGKSNGSDATAVRVRSTRSLSSHDSSTSSDTKECSSKVVVIEDDDESANGSDNVDKKGRSGKSSSSKTVVSLDLQLQNISDIDELNANHLWHLVMRNTEYFRDISTGKIACKRHQQYLTGEKRLLSYATLECIYSDEQKQEVIGALQKIFSRNKRNFEYVLKVLLPEALVRIYQKINKLSDRDEAERRMCEEAMIMSSMSQTENL